ncbi:hypothetical protein HOK51_08215 [Candidatus Woesearchaeota archaeon]|jgi:O-acetyl-ADP-ribose deacetylase|nr:hypothetical protein [Candidatus Woesearchaeota archaeon]MBT6519809.1 hypothetical protein [Candidatus Woesearchaeota archaeon]MBT7368188.1 hypothetical protein [Candidatus Woesearchaeota archaeon]
MKQKIKSFGNLDLYLMQGDLTQVPVDAIMTAINSGAMWFGGIDGAIQRAAGTRYHDQAMQNMPLKNLDVVDAKGDSDNHAGMFDNVIFVVDNLESSLDQVVYKGLEAAHNIGYETLAVPAIRMGVMQGVVEKTPEETVRKIGEGVLNFLEVYGDKTSLKELTFVVYNDPNSQRLISEGISLLPIKN